MSDGLSGGYSGSARWFAQVDRGFASLQGRNRVEGSGVDLGEPSRRAGIAAAQPVRHRYRS
jgi:hypothetical protein